MEDKCLKTVGLFPLKNRSGEQRNFQVVLQIGGVHVMCKGGGGGVIYAGVTLDNSYVSNSRRHFISPVSTKNGLCSSRMSCSQMDFLLRLGQRECLRDLHAVVPASTRLQRGRHRLDHATSDDSFAFVYAVRRIFSRQVSSKKTRLVRLDFAHGSRVCRSPSTVGTTPGLP